LLGSRLALGVGPTLDVGVDDSGHYRAWQARPQFEEQRVAALLVDVKADVRPRYGFMR
jgi:hypothetical protein